MANPNAFASALFALGFTEIEVASHCSVMQFAQESEVRRFIDELDSDRFREYVNWRREITAAEKLTDEDAKDAIMESWEAFMSMLYVREYKRAMAKTKRRAASKQHAVAKKSTFKERWQAAVKKQQAAVKARAQREAENKVAEE